MHDSGKDPAFHEDPIKFAKPATYFPDLKSLPGTKAIWMSIRKDQSYNFVCLSHFLEAAKKGAKSWCVCSIGPIKAAVLTQNLLSALLCYGS